MSSLHDVETAKQRLSETLRDRIQKYWEIMKDWYKRRITKDEFDSKAKFLLGENNLQLHNDFLFSMLVKCQIGSAAPQHVAALSPTPMPDTPPSQPSQQPLPIFHPTTITTTTTTTALKPPKPKRLKPAPPPSLPYGALDVMRYHKAPGVQLLPTDLDTLLLCTHDLMLPDLPIMHTRMMLGVWELGLEGVTEEAAELLVLALQYHLKNIIQALVASQTSWITKRGTGFQHSFGHGPSHASPSSLTQHSSDLQKGRGALRGVREAETIRIASQSCPVREMEPLNLFHLRDALRVNRHCVPVHSVYSFSMERILAGMWHPSKDEEEQRRVVQQWKRSTQKDTPFAIPAAANYGRR